MVPEDTFVVATVVVNVDPSLMMLLDGVTAYVGAGVNEVSLTVILAVDPT